MLVIFAWLVVASRRVYGVSWQASTTKTLLVEIGYFLFGIAITFLTLGLAIFSLVRIALSLTIREPSRPR